MTSLDERQTETERQIRERLEQTGEFGKMRAMIVDAALQSLARDQPSGGRGGLFTPQPALAEAKASPQGTQALAAVYAYLQRLGLTYTANVLALEADVPVGVLASSGGGADDATAAATSMLAAVGAGAAVPVPVPVPIVGRGAAAAPAPASSPHSSAASSVASGSQGTDTEGEEGEEGEAAGEEAPQPGAEDTTYFISKWRRRTFTRVHAVVGQQVQVEYLTDCTVIVLDPLDSMTVDDCEGGELIVAACEGSVFLRNCKNMTVHVACKQLRTRDCANIDLHILTTTDPVVEMSHHMTFRPFHVRLPDLTASLKAARLDPAQNRFVHVYDFTTDEPSLPHPHFTVLYPNHGVQMEDRCAEHGTPVCPPEVEDLLAGKLLPAASSESGQNKSYNIKTGSAAWAAAAAAATEPTVANGKAAEPEESEESEDEEEEEKAAADDFDDESVESEEVVEEEKEEGDKPSAIEVPSAGARPPVAPAVSSGLGGPKLGGLDDQDYSSFDESSELANEDDKFEVEEDDDDF